MAIKHLLDPTLLKEPKAKSKYKEIAVEKTKELEDIRASDQQKIIEVSGDISNDFSMTYEKDKQGIV